MRWSGAALLVLAWAGTVSAGEILFTNGSRLDAELANEVLLVSTGSGLLEVVPEEIVLLTRDEIRLQDGRVIRGTLVGGLVKAQTALGAIVIRAEEFQAFSVARPAAKTVAGSPSPTGSLAGGVVRLVSGDGLAPAAEPETSGPAVAALRPVSTPPSPESTTRANGRVFEVIAGESALYRDAYTTAGQVGRVVRGDLVAYVDFIDRRLRILNALIFDGGHWLKVRAANGAVGWVPAEIVREVR